MLSNNNQITKKRIYNFCLNSNFGGATPQQVVHSLLIGL